MPTLTTPDGVELELPEVPDGTFSRREQSIITWPDPVQPSQWAERNRYLHSDEADREGPWRNANAPYLVGLMNLAAKRGVEQLTIKKAAQVGVSEGFRNVTGYWADTDPAPMGLVLPNKDKGTEIVDNKVLPFFRRTKVLKRHFTSRAHDLKKAQVKLLNGFTMHLMWSGSPASLASNPMKRAICDEVNKFEKWAGNDADPVSLVRKRLRTYADSVIILISSPTTRFGVISTNFRASFYQLYFLLPCPHCGTRQRLVFSNVIIPKSISEMADKNAAAAKLVREEAAVYRCVHCSHDMDERAKRQACLVGKWGTVAADQVTASAPEGVNDLDLPLISDADAIDEFPKGSWVGAQLGALYCMWESCTMSHVGAELFRAGSDPARVFDFRTGTLGEDWNEQVEKTNTNVFSKKSRGIPIAADEKAQPSLKVLPEGVLPWWTAKLIAVVDTQKDHFYLTLRAWGPHMLSRRIYHSRVESFDDLDEWGLLHPWHFENSSRPAVTPDLMLIDSGGTRAKEDVASRTQAVYEWALKRKSRVRPIKGASKPRETRELYWVGSGVFAQRTPAGKILRQHDLNVWLLDTHQCQDILQEMIAKTISLPDVGLLGAPSTGELLEVEQWGLNAHDDPTYNAHMGNLTKNRDREKGSVVEIWEPVQDGARVDYRHTEGYQIAAAYMTGVHVLPDLGEWKRQLEAALKLVRETPRRAAGGFQTPDGRPFHVGDR